MRWKSDWVFEGSGVENFEAADRRTEEAFTPSSATMTAHDLAKSAICNAYDLRY